MKQRGFTIVELIITIFILSSSVLGIFSAFLAVIILTHNISDRFMAAYLAQEGVEIIRNMRDNNWISSQPDWRQGFDVCQDGCEADYTTGTGVPGAKPLTFWVGGSSGGNYLKISGNGFYNYSAGSDTKFKRKITVIFLNENIIKVSVLATWREKASLLNPAAVSGLIEAEETLYNWY